MTDLKKIDIDIIEYIIDNKNAKQIDISQIFDIDRGNLSRKCNQFKQKNILKDSSKLEFNPLFIRNLIIEIQYNNIRFFLSDAFGCKLSTEENLYYQNEVELQTKLAQIFNVINPKEYDCIGCIVHSQIKNNKISHFHNSDINDFPIYDFLHSLSNKNIYIENFSNVAALTHFMTSYSNKHSLFFIRTSPGIGAGLIYHGKIFHGFSGSAMEPGCMLFDKEQPGVYNRSFEKYENELLQATDILENPLLDLYLKDLNLIIKIIISFVDPEVLVIDSDFLNQNKNILFRIPYDGVVCSQIEDELCYKSICQISLKGETAINYKHL